ncbi:hypothetical protein FN846DRAFT_123987 [Sphaerosporella brunnea]|uniref:Uncharacterized protein n=1 Tax=Sphaerosporella brunnea TaxID=1250544 RepID=A0A5J5ERS8_9PEZI|nr:hypothetical protein FN846DRAFT_123987 [Sphaerosporella brunnea]
MSPLLRQPKTLVLYSYLVAGFTLPFAVPAFKKNTSTSSHERPLSLHHCCR